MTERTGLTTVLQEGQTAHAHTEKPNPEQLTLLGQISGASAADLASPEGIHRGRGRPPGSKNKRTAEMVDFLGGRFGYPLERVLKRASADPVALAKEMGVDVFEVVKLQNACDIAALPFMHQKLPLAVEVEHRLAALILNQGKAADDLAGDALENFLSNQGVIDGEYSKLDASQLDATTKTAENGEKE